MTRAAVERFRGIVEERLGLLFDNTKLDELEALLRQRIHETEVRTVERYLRQLRPTSTEWSVLIDRLTVPESYFFRVMDHFQVLKEVALPKRMRAQRGAKRLRIVSAGCATGEEPYTIAMLLREQLPLASGWEFDIYGLDLNPVVLQKARRGIYTEWSLRATPSNFRERYFKQVGKRFEIDSSIRKAVQFEEANLVSFNRPEWHGSVDIVFFRNVLIYFAPLAAQHALRNLQRIMAPGAYLVLGPAETLRGLSQDFLLHHTHETFYYQYGARQESASIDAGSLHIPGEIVPGIELNDTEWFNDIQRSFDRIRELTDESRPEAGSATAPPSETPKSIGAGIGRSGFDRVAISELMKNEQWSEALTMMEALPTSSMDESDARLFQSVLLMNSGRLREAEERCGELLVLDDLNAGAHYVMALLREHAGDHNAALDHDSTAIYLDASFSMPHLHRGLISKRAGKHSVARHELSEALLLLERESPSRILLFGGGFTRDALKEMCRRELKGIGGGV